MPACPYCRSDIPDRAIVCAHCTRDVGRLLATKRRLHRLLKERQKQAKQELSVSSNLATPAYYVLATLVVWATIPTPQLTSLLLIIVTVAASASLALTRSAWRAGRFFLTGFAQPVLTVAMLLVFTDTVVENPIKYLQPLFKDAVRTGVAFALGGLLAGLATRVLHREPIAIEWMPSDTLEFEAFEKLLLKVVAVATPLISLATLVAPLIESAMKANGK